MTFTDKLRYDLPVLLLAVACLVAGIAIGVDRERERAGLVAWQLTADESVMLPPGVSPWRIAALIDGEEKRFAVPVAGCGGI